MTVNWKEPIEAVHQDGRTFAAVFDNASSDGHYWIESGQEPEDCALFYYESGEPASPTYRNWRIRNVQPAAAKPTELDAALVERMMALVRRIADGFYLHAVNEAGIGTTDAVVQAQGIVRELPEPVDADLLEAREMVAAEYGDCSNVAHLAASARSGDGDEWFHTKVALRAIRRGRALEREGK